MGMFDTVMVPCPTCGEQAEFQSKGGKCLLETFTLEEAPDDVLLDVNRHSPVRCSKCKTQFGVAVEGQLAPRRTLRAQAVVWPWPDVNDTSNATAVRVEQHKHGADCECSFCKDAYGT